uniref:Uncharacterized protein n=1 Tax=Anguilla anguilla TaxID=7936 RepID=A0A0E9PHR5_ANGAN
MSADQCLCLCFLSPLNSQICIHLCNEAFMQPYYNIPLCVAVERLFLLTKSDHILHCHY